jgi:hypothetical protein
MAGFIFNRGALGLLDGSIDWSADTIKARLVLTSETLSKDSTSMTGIGDALTDVTLSGKTGPTEDTGNDRIGYDASDPTFSAVASTSPMDQMVIFKFVTDDAGSTPIAVLAITEKTPSGADVVVTLPSGAAFYTQQ